MELEFHQLERRYEALRVLSPQRERRLLISLERPTASSNRSSSCATQRRRIGTWSSTAISGFGRSSA